MKKLKIAKFRKVAHAPAVRSLLEAFAATEDARKLSVIEAAEALWRGSRHLFSRAGVESPSALAQLVIRDRSAAM